MGLGRGGFRAEVGVLGRERLQERQAELHPACEKLGLHAGDSHSRAGPSATDPPSDAGARSLIPCPGFCLEAQEFRVHTPGGRVDPPTAPLEEEVGGLGGRATASHPSCGSFSRTHPRPHLPAFWKLPLFFCFLCPWGTGARKKSLSCRELCHSPRSKTK